MCNCDKVQKEPYGALYVSGDEDSINSRLKGAEKVLTDDGWDWVEFGAHSSAGTSGCICITVRVEYGNFVGGSIINPDNILAGAEVEV